MTNEQTSEQTNRHASAVGPTIIEPCMEFFKVAKESGLEDEQAMVSLTATMFIRYSNLCDKNPNFNQLIKRIDESIGKEKASVNELIMSYYEPLIRSSKKVGDKVEMYIKEKLKGPVSDFKAFDEGLREYLYRNGYEFEYICALTPVISKEE